MRVRILTILFAGLFLTQLLAQGQFGIPLNKKDTRLPKSREATFVESFSPTEVTILATGIGTNAAKAEKDLKKAAVFFVLGGGTDPILSTPEEKQRFAAIQEEFFRTRVINQFITFIAEKAQTMRVIKKKGKKYKKMSKLVRVDKQKIKDYLVEQKIIESREDIAEAVGTPFIMVIPESKDPLDELQNSMLAKTAATVIQSYLTARQYDVQVPEAAAVLDELSNLQSEMAGMEEDATAQLAQVIGCDVYITYAAVINSDEVGAQKASVTVKAYETTTARLLGAETGYSLSMKVNSPEALLEVAIGDAIDKVLSRVMNYWKKDVKYGLQYKLVFRISTEFGEDEAEDISDVIFETVESEFAKLKENLVTSQTMDFLVWAPKDEFRSGSSIYRMLRRKIESELDMVDVKKISVNRKMILIKLLAN